MKNLNIIALMVLLLSLVAHAQGDAENMCVACHQELDSLQNALVLSVAQSVHRNAELSCQGCHGGDPTSDDPEVSMSPAKGFVGRPDKAETAKMCARCHSDPIFMRTFNPNIAVDQYERYLTSQHGILLVQGDTNVAVCTDCHGVHDIRQAKDPVSKVFPTNISQVCGGCHANAQYMQPYGISTSQLEDYNASVHAEILYEKGDLSAPTCNDCHGNHGAVPPGVASIANVCGACHYVQSEYFSNSPHKPAFDEMGFGECEACHSNHKIVRPAVQMLGTSDGATCIECHDSDTPGYQSAALMRAKIDSLQNAVDSARDMFARARRAGVEIPGEESLSLANAADALIQTKVLIHTFDPARVEESAGKGMEVSAHAITAGQNALHELTNRRRMLVIMVVLTLTVAFFLILYIRHSEKAASH